MAPRDARLLKIIAAMEEQGEEPLDAAALADVAGISVRQMERLFCDELKERPMGFYLKLRLERAERLLTYSAWACARLRWPAASPRWPSSPAPSGREPAVRQAAFAEP